MDNKENNNNNNDLDIFNGNSSDNNNNNNNNYTIEETNTNSSNNNIILEPLQVPSKELQSDFVEELSSEPIKIQDYKIDGEINNNNNIFGQGNTNMGNESNLNNSFNNNNNNNNKDAQANINTQSENPYNNPVNNPYSSSYGGVNNTGSDNNNTESDNNNNNNNNNNSNITSNNITQTTTQNTQFDNKISAEQMEEQIRIQKRIEFLEQKKQKRKKTVNLIGKGVKIASCVLVFGVGVGVGTTLSNNIILESEKENFKFDISNLTGEYNDNLILTSGSASPIFKNAGDSVVNISTQSTHGIFITQTSEGSGSGIIYKIEDDLVYIITNNHVIEDAQYVTISVTGEEQISGRLVGTDATSDLAVFSVSKQEMIDAGIETILVAKFANSDEVEVGDFVYPIGNALGEGKTMTQGMISANNKQINIDGNNLTVLQTDAAINPGNSGGALIDSAGLVVGINTAKLASSQIEGIGYAIPSNIATEISDQIIENGYVQRPYFGVAAKTITQSVKEIYGIQYDGVLVSEVEKGSNAEKAGLVPTDIIISFNGSDIKTAEDLSNAIKSAKLNETFDFEVIRNNSEKLDLTVTFAIPTQQDNMKEFSTETTTKETTQSTTKEMTTESTTKDQQEETSEEISNVIPETMTEAHKSKKEENNITENNTTENNTIENITESTTESDSSALNLEDSSNNYFSDEVIPDNNINSTTEIIMTPDEIVDSILESLIGSVVDPQNINPNIDFNE